MPRTWPWASRGSDRGAVSGIIHVADAVIALGSICTAPGPRNSVTSNDPSGSHASAHGSPATATLPATCIAATFTTVSSCEHATYAAAASASTPIGSLHTATEVCVLVARSIA